MLGRFAPIFCFVVIAALAVRAAETTGGANSSDQLLVLRNGEVLSGRISQQGDRYLVTGEGSEVRFAARDVDFVCQSPDEAYATLRRRIVAGRIEDHLNLAEWCIRNQLLGYAAGEVAAAMKIDPKNPRVVRLDRRLQQSMQPTEDQTQNSASDLSAIANDRGAVQPTSPDELERLVHSLSANSVETYTKRIQPMLMHSCATAGCHGPSPGSAYVLARPAVDRSLPQRLTQRNLFNTLEWIDRDNPTESKLLAAARQSHGATAANSGTTAGNAGSAVLDPVKYQELQAWVCQTAQGLNANSTPAANGFSTSGPGMNPYGVLASPWDNGSNVSGGISPSPPNAPNPQMAKRSRKAPLVGGVQQAGAYFNSQNPTGAIPVPVTPSATYPPTFGAQQPKYPSMDFGGPAAGSPPASADQH
jgi:hypothetical protein